MARKNLGTNRCGIARVARMPARGAIGRFSGHPKVKGRRTVGPVGMKAER
jgi:hypothetical protein